MIGLFLLKPGGNGIPQRPLSAVPCQPLRPEWGDERVDWFVFRVLQSFPDSINNSKIKSIHAGASFTYVLNLLPPPVLLPELEECPSPFLLHT